MAKLTNVSCVYTGGGIYVYTAQFNDEVWLGTDFDLVGSYDTPWETITDELNCDYDSHWKDPSVPYPTWGEILASVYENCDSATYSDVARTMEYYGDMLGKRILGDDEPVRQARDEHSARLEMLCDIIEVFEDFLDEKGIVIPNDEKDQDPDASNIYGTDYGNLESRLESLLISFGLMKEEK
jgi:hypothetical protein